MKDIVTLVIILHNRHRNVDRLLEYYEDFESPIIIADSSAEPHSFEKTRHNLTYLYTPGITYTQKIEQTIDKVFTPYISLCADDDFIIPDGLYNCIKFLEENKDYSVAQGLILNYYKYTIKQKLRFGLLYKNNHSLPMDKPFERLQKIFTPYKSLLYAVHRTSILKTSFKHAEKNIKNLYLNEYLISIMSILLGKSKDLPFLYQVREYADNSDDKSADNLEVMIGDNKYNKELMLFQDVLINNSQSVTLDKEELKKKIREAMETYARQLESFKNSGIPLRKKIGKIIALLPFFGKEYVERNRFNESIKELKTVLTDKDFEELKKIEILLKKYDEVGPS